MTTNDPGRNNRVHTRSVRQIGNGLRRTMEQLCRRRHTWRRFCPPEGKTVKRWASGWHCRYRSEELWTAFCRCRSFRAAPYELDFAAAPLRGLAATRPAMSTSYVDCVDDLATATTKNGRRQQHVEERAPSLWRRLRTGSAAAASPVLRRHRRLRRRRRCVRRSTSGR